MKTPIQYEHSIGRAIVWKKRSAASRVRRLSRKAFSLVEIVVAIGIVSFAFLTIFGLIPTGLQTFRSAIDTSISAQIFQRVINEAQQTDFATLTSGTPVVRYFDDQGNECIAGKAIYYVNTRISSSTSLTTTNTTVLTNNNIATVTVQIANNPSKMNLDTIKITDATSPLYNLWKSKAGVSVTTHSTMVARNK